VSAACSRCGKTGFFLQLYRGLCSECVQQVKTELEQARQTIHNKLDMYERLERQFEQADDSDVPEISVTLDEALDVVIPLIESLNVISKYSAYVKVSGLEDIIRHDQIFRAGADGIIIWIYGVQQAQLRSNLKLDFDLEMPTPEMNVSIQKEKADAKIKRIEMNISTLREAIKLSQKAKEFFSKYSDIESHKNYEDNERSLKDELAQNVIMAASVKDTKATIEDVIQSQADERNLKADVRRLKNELKNNLSQMGIDAADINIISGTDGSEEKPGTNVIDIANYKADAANSEQNTKNLKWLRDDSMKTLIVGFDSAWTRNKSGALVGVLHSDCRVFQELGSPHVADFKDAHRIISGWKKQHKPGKTIVMLDQPTIVRNAEGQRPVENIVASPVSLRYGGVQPANTKKDEMFGDAAPVWEFLSHYGDSANPFLPSLGTFVLETYPVLSIIALGWTLIDSRKTGRLPKYNPERGKTFSTLDWSHICQSVASELRKFELHDLSQWAETLKSSDKPRKRDQDGIDACICLITGLHLADGKQCIMVGDTNSGYMIVPFTDALYQELVIRCEKTGCISAEWVQPFTRYNLNMECGD